MLYNSSKISTTFTNHRFEESCELYIPLPPSRLPLSRHVPNHASKEVLVVMGALTSCDPGNIFNTIKVSGELLGLRISGLLV